MKNYLFFLVTTFFTISSFSQVKIEAGDPPNNTDIPEFYKSKLSDIENEIKNIKKGEVKLVATSPGGLPVYAVSYGKKEDFKSQANYNSAIAARNPAYYAIKDSLTKPVVFFIGPVHGQEAEGIAGLVNLIHIAETGKDYRGKDYISLKRKMEKCRTIIIPCGNPDGRKRCPYDSFVWLPKPIMTKYGQGTRKDGTSWGWPHAKSVHPMKGDVGILGAYFNDDGINLVQDEFFSLMATETAAIMEIARSEAPDITVTLHSSPLRPHIVQPWHIPIYIKKRVNEIAISLNRSFQDANLAYWPMDRIWTPAARDVEFPPGERFNLVSALHHISGTMSFTFECSHGTVSEKVPEPLVNYDDILDMQLILYDKMFDYILNNRLFWDI